MDAVAMIQSSLLFSCSLVYLARSQVQPKSIYDCTQIQAIHTRRPVRGIVCVWDDANGRAQPSMATSHHLTRVESKDMLIISYSPSTPRNHYQPIPRPTLRCVDVPGLNSRGPPRHWPDKDCAATLPPLEFVEASFGLHSQPCSSTLRLPLPSTLSGIALVFLA